MLESLIAASTGDIISGAVNIGKVLAGLGFVIFVHELGHFLVAKACGVKCEKFYVGFDVPIKIGPLKLPASIVKFQWGETEYGIGIIPLGGYVKMLGQDDNPANAESEAAKIRQQDSEGSESGTLDPQSYPAKSVPQRMAIISAGVIMNLIFGIIMAAVAYKMGTPIQPASVGQVSYGSNAWLAGWKPGYDLVGFSDTDDTSHFYRFTWDLRYAVIGGGMDGTDGIPFQVVDREGNQHRMPVVPVQSSPDSKQVTVGITSATNTTVVLTAGGDSTTPTASELQIDDQILAVDGVAVHRDQHGPKPELLGWHAQELIAMDPSKTLELTVQRNGKSVSVELPPLPLKQADIVFGMGPIVGVIPGSLGEQVGFKTGDVIEMVNDEIAGDPITLPQRVGRLAGEKVVFQVRRSDHGLPPYTVLISVDPLPSAVHLEPAAPHSQGCLPALGIAYGCDHIVQSSTQAMIQPGDRLDSVQYVLRSTSDEDVDSRRLQKQMVGEYLTWFFLHQTGQSPRSDVVLQLNFSRDKTSQAIAAIPRWTESTEYYSSQRGIYFAALERIHQADGWGAAFQLGMHRTWQDMTRVGQTIGWIAGGKASVRDLGGPVMIIKVAKDEASVDVTRLLLFLTMLSANLAIINFLPIPILDGGHFVFLTIELIRRKPVSERIQGSLSMLFLFVLLGFMVFIVSNDVVRLWFE
ncbi:MAG: site-2 protease family protein [Planctomycetota bacterium]|nr:site-2 protease family protein [Planctomycetota bacterium]